MAAWPVMTIWLPSLMADATKGTHGIQMMVFGPLAMLLLVMLLSGSAKPSLPAPHTFLASIEPDGLLVGQEFDDGVAALALDFQLTNDTTHLSLGPHSARFVVHPQKCSFPRLFVRLFGPAVVSIELTQQSANEWSNPAFHIPMAGDYRVETMWQGCGTEAGESVRTRLPIEKSVANEGEPFPDPQQPQVLAQSVWVKESEDDDYVWKPPSVTNGKTLAASKVSIVEEGTSLPGVGYMKFQQVSNYELVWYVRQKPAAVPRLSHTQPPALSGTAPCRAFAPTFWSCCRKWPRVSVRSNFTSTQLRVLIGQRVIGTNRN